MNTFDLPYGIKPVKFYPYPHIVFDAVVSTDYRDNKELKDLKIYLLDLFNEEGIYARGDNKIAFELETESGVRVFYGFKDWTFRLGFRVNELD